jgi:hypothetical protein
MIEPQPALHEALRLALEVTDLVRMVKDRRERGEVTEARAALPVLMGALSALHFSWPLVVIACQEPGLAWPESERHLLLELRCFRDQADAACEDCVALVRQHLAGLKGGGA